jgi:16S rRNA (guanine527-N7)-methyltransferase
VAAAFPDFIRTRIERAGVRLDSAGLSAAATYLGLLTKWNETVNLTALKLNPASDEAIDRLLIEPFLAADSVRPLLGLPGSTAAPLLLDVGSGGGSPAIPLAIALGSDRPVELRMVESKVRKAAFLRDAIRQIPLPSAQVFNDRLEELSRRSELRDSFNLVSMRAVRADSDLWAALEPLVRPDGRVLWFQSAGETTPGFIPKAFAIETVKPLVAGSQLVLMQRR